MVAPLVLLADLVVEVGRVESQRVERHGATNVTESVLRLDDGRTSRVRHLGGTLDGIGVVVMGEPTLSLGERVALWREGPWLRARAGLGEPRRYYVRATTNRTGAPFYWSGSDCVTLVPNSAGSDDMAPAEALAAVQKAATNWDAAAAGCGYMSILIGPARADAVPGFTGQGENTNVVYWHEDFWGADADTPYPATNPALTNLRFVDDPAAQDSGRLVDADIELNGVNFRFTTGECAGRMDLENTLTHEMGHVLGLDHTCDDGSRHPTPVDDHGDPIPACDGPLPESVRLATMYPFARACDTFMRTPEADDVRGVCAIYPLAEDPGTCGPPDPAEIGSDGCSCAVGGRPGGAVMFVAALLTARAGSRFRRRSGCAAGSSGRPRSSCGA
jgi:hypothetical protein